MKAHEYGLNNNKFLIMGFKMLNTHELEHFKSWLKVEKKLQDRSMKDVVSRLRRISSMVGTANKLDINSLNEVTNKASFSSLTVSVRSQLKRSAKLYFEFKNIKYE
jgi:DNA (cytosine-5)-methyltransferase 1